MLEVSSLRRRTAFGASGAIAIGVQPPEAPLEALPELPPDGSPEVVASSPAPMPAPKLERWLILMLQPESASAPQSSALRSSE